MILDERNEFADATALDTGGTGRVLVGDVIDLGAVSQDIGNGQPLYAVIQVDTAVTSGGSATVSLRLHLTHKQRLLLTVLQLCTL